MGAVTLNQGVANQERTKTSDVGGKIVKSAHQRARARSDASGCAYNLFRNKQRSEIFCAVPQDCPIPKFVACEQWMYAGSLQPEDARPSGFHDTAASVGVRFNGFYLFQVTAAPTKAGVIGHSCASKADQLPEPAMDVTIRQHVRKALLRLVASQSSPDQVIECLSRPAADHKSAEARYADLLAALPFAVYTTDATGRITFYNEAAVALWGRRPVLGQDRWCGSWHIYTLNGAPLPHDRCPMAVAILEDRNVRGVTAIAERPDGTRVHFRPMPTPLHDANDNLVGAVNVLLDLGAA
jgi:PAS domain-containing protein